MKTVALTLGWLLPLVFAGCGGPGPDKDSIFELESLGPYPKVIYCEGQFFGCAADVRVTFTYDPGENGAHGADAWLDHCLFDISWSSSPGLKVLPSESVQKQTCVEHGLRSEDRVLLDDAWIVTDCRNGSTGTVVATATDGKGKIGHKTFTLDQRFWSGSETENDSSCASLPDSFRPAP
jgi:hypothetical protein